MYDGMVADGYIVADGGAAFLIGTMDACPILDIHLVANAYIVYISPDHSVEPEAAITTRYHIAHDGGVGSYETIFTKLWKFALYGKNDRHMHDLRCTEPY